MSVLFRYVVVLVLAALAVSACGGGDSDDSGPRIISSDDDTVIELPDDDEVVELVDTGDASAPEEGESAAEVSEPSSDEEAEAPDDTIPLAEDDGGPLALLDAVAAFQACLSGEGFEFLGPPDPTDPNALSSQQPYVDALIKCNTETGVQQAFEESQAADADLSPEEIQERNESFVIVVDCLRGKGWDIEDPVPDGAGLLQPAPDGFASPDGTINNDDIAACIAENNLAEGN